MRQILLSSRGAAVARMPRPTAGRGQVVVRVDSSLVSAGTETAPLRSIASDPSTTRIEQAGAYWSLARRYLGKAIKDPKKAYRKARGIAQREYRRFRPATRSSDLPGKPVGPLEWSKGDAKSFTSRAGGFELLTDASDASYQAVSKPVRIEDGKWPAVDLSGHVRGGGVDFGVLDEGRENWLGQVRLEPGDLTDRIVFDTQDSSEVTFVVSNAGAGEPCSIDIEKCNVELVSSTEAGIASNEMADHGWKVGYSAAGVVESVGPGVTDLVPGDRVACGGAAYASHADWIAVPRNLCARVPHNVSLRDASTTTVGTIALQGVRRTEPQLGETIAVVGLGLIGQITVQLLRANGCTVIGLDLDPERVERARALGLADGSSSADEFKKLVLDRTGGHGADATVITAATRTSAVVNQTMAFTRRRGRVVLVGDVGLDLERPEFYKRELDLRMSTSYGPGRYDANYEEGGQDYPYAHVRWTLNRNMSAYLGLIADGRVDIEPLVDRVFDVDDAPRAYDELVRSEKAPLGVFFRFPDETGIAEAPDATRIRLRGHRPAPTAGDEGESKPASYALIGAGAFGTCMLVPQMAKRRDRFFLRAVVSRDPQRGGNFARENRVEILASDIDAVLGDPEIELVVIATRHDEHADQVIRSLRAGKHVFVEKPLALTWDELRRVEETIAGLENPPLLLCGFNRRFSPALDTLRSEIATRRSPLVIQYRLNGGAIPLEHWTQTAAGGGRNIGEACHMYDVFRSLTGAPVTSISASSIDPGEQPFRRNDNFSATLTYADGSVANLIYTALGPKTGLGKERIEVFADGEAYVVEDFTKLTRGSDGEVLFSRTEPDKGHREELSRFGDAIATGGPSPIPLDEIFETTAVALRIEDLLHGRDELENGDDRMGL